MRNILFAALFFLTHLAVSQTITGVVKEKSSGLPLPFANVFINNSTIGAATDKDGRFEIKGKIPEDFELVASFIGYKTSSIVIKRNGKQVVSQVFELEFLEDNLSEVELKAKRDRSWERNYKMFKEVFLAVPDDPYGRDIEILNPWVLDFETVKPDKGFNYTQASAQQPLQVVNKALGYQIDYYLQDFRMLRNASRFYGQAFYQELEPEDSVAEGKWKEGKELNYLNSVRHLALSMLLKNSGSQGFELYQAKPGIPREDRTNDFYYELNKSIIPVMLEFVYTKPLGNGNYRIFLPERIEVHHLNKPWLNDYYTNIYHAISWIMAPSGYFDVDRSGTLLHPTQLVLSGFMGRQRVARSLPLDFMPDESFAGFMEDFQVFQNRYIKLNNQREKPWLTTNKSFYYPGETLWLGGKMLYQNPAMQDTLSRVLYVDILNDQLKTVHQEIFPIQKGKISAGLVLSDTLRKGNYLLRAYTRWSLNYGEMDIFQLPFPVLDSNEILAVQESDEEVLFGDIGLVHDYELVDSVSYRVMNLVLKASDSYGNTVEADLLLSGLERTHFTESEPKYRLENELDWLDQDLKETFDSEMPFPIEYGISVEGKFFPAKKKDSMATSITVVRGDLEDYGQVQSDSSGRFWATGLQFQDSAQIAIAAVDEKLKPYGKVELVPFAPPVFRGSFPKTPYQVMLKPAQEEALLDLSGEYFELEEFVKEETKERETMADRNYGYGDPTQQVGPEELERMTMAEILGKLRFVGGKFANYTFGEKTGTPLLIIDGQSRPFLTSNEFNEILNSYEPSMLKSIKVYYGNINNAIFGMAGYAGVIMIETKNGFRTGPESDRKFNSEGFGIFLVKGYTSFPEFPINPPKDQYLRKKATLYWDPLAKTENGELKLSIKIPYGISTFKLRIEGITEDGDPIYQVIPIELK